MYLECVCLLYKHTITFCGGGGDFIIIILIFVKRGVLRYYFANQSEGTINWLALLDVSVAMCTLKKQCNTMNA